MNGFFGWSMLRAQRKAPTPTGIIRAQFLKDQSMHRGSPHEYQPLDAASGAPLYRQLYLRVRDAIAAGLLKPGDRVPATRTLAQQLGLARGTVAAAYNMLTAEGYLEARGQGGSVVGGRTAGAAQAASAAPVSATTVHILHANGTGTPLPFQMGLPALDAFPRKMWARLAARAARATQTRHMVRESSYGAPALRAAIAAHLHLARGIDCTDNQVFVTSGYRGSMELTMRALLAPGDRVWTEDPGFPPTGELLRGAGMTPVPVPVDADGLVVGNGIALAPDARAAVVTPAHQAPLAVAMSPQRRQALLDWAQAAGAWIVEDDYDGEFSYEGKPLPALASMDRGGRVIYTGTFSKVLFPSIRLAYVVVPPGLVERFERVCSVISSGSPALTQAIVGDFIQQGYFSRHIQRMRKLYAERRALTASGLSAALGGRLRIDSPSGGMHLLAHLPEDGGGNPAADRVLAERMRRHGMAPQVLSDWYAAAPARNALLLAFTNIESPEQAAELGARIARLLD
jgi:GntR family transcriptional regulator/MocR family aminotransferase